MGKIRLFSCVASVAGIFLLKWKKVSKEINVTVSLASALFFCSECNVWGGEEAAKISLEIIGKEGYGKQ